MCQMGKCFHFYNFTTENLARLHSTLRDYMFLRIVAKALLYQMNIENYMSIRHKTR